MADWRIYPNTRISRLPGPLRRLALGLRNAKALFATSAFPPLAQIRDLEALELGVEYVMGARVPGDIAEFGAHGFTASAIAQAMDRLTRVYDDHRILHLFDSFEGFPDLSDGADRDAPHVQDDVWRKGGCLSPLDAKSLTREMRLWLPADRIAVYPGWFSNTLPDLPPDTQLAMVHFDCGLYSSTREVLDYLFSRQMLSTGALIMFHTWNCNQASPSHGDRRAWGEACDAFEVQAEDAGPHSWHGRSFHVHSYKGLES